MVGKDPYEGMSPEEKKLTKGLEYLKQVDDGLTKEEFTNAIKEVMAIVVEMNKRNSQAITNLQQEHSSFMQEERGSHEMTLSDMKKQVNQVFVGERMDEIKKQVNEMIDLTMGKMHGKLSEVDSKMKSVKSGYTPIKGKDYFDGKDGKHGNILTPYEVRDKLERLPVGEKLSIQAIEDLAKILEELKSRPVGTVGGLISKRIRFIDDETPTGTINGSNTDFTISKAPETGSLKVYVNGARMRVTEDYTLSGRTITFLTPPPTNSIIFVDFRY